nr:hypothetical protein Itr_chr12CG23950 [Ipomoea trifida]
MAVELEKLLIPLIKEASRTAIKKITECGCSTYKLWQLLALPLFQEIMLPTCWELRGVKNRNNGEAVSIHCLPVVNYKAQSD